MEYLLLGAMGVTAASEPLGLGGFRQRSVLAVLLLSADRIVDSDALVDQVWDQPPPKPMTSLRSYVANLRRILAADGRTDRLLTDGRGYRLRLDDDRLDTRQFEAGVAYGRRLLDAGDAVAAARTLTDALALWRGGPLSDFRDQPFAGHEIHRLEALRADAVETRYEAELQQGRHAELIAGLEGEVAINPLRERLWGQLMLAMYRAGRRTDALAAYERLRDILDRELGVGPGLALERLAAEIRDESGALEWSPEPHTQRVKVRGPGSSLFGRIPELTRLRDALTDAIDGRGGVAVLTGESGVGKTALATELADIADDLGVHALWVGHAAGLRTPPAWAWTQVLRGLAGRTGRLVNARPHAESADTPEGFAFIEATVAVLAEMVGRRSTLVVLDDLHRADRTSRDVLELLAASVHRMPLLILATWQEGGIDRPVREREFDRLLSRCEVTSMRLVGIDRDATARLIEDVAGHVPSPEFVHSVERRTGGNPFYIKELTRLLCDSGRLGEAADGVIGEDVPHAVSGVIRRRMSALAPSTRSALTVAALRGAEFSVAGVAEVLDEPATQVAASLQAAMRAGLIAELAGQPGRCRFSHGLVRDAVAAQLSGQPRVR